jgi:hypothetical protein
LAGFVENVNSKHCFQKTFVLAPWHGRIQVGHMDVARKNSFVLQKEKRITCSTMRKVFCTSGRGKVECGLFQVGFIPP